MWTQIRVQVWTRAGGFPSRRPVRRASVQVKAQSTIHRGMWTTVLMQFAQPWGECARRPLPVGKNPGFRAGSAPPHWPGNAVKEPIPAPVHTRTPVIHRG
ncbi:hypothetical protein GCM10027456_57040 [Kineosporia babensis]